MYEAHSSTPNIVIKGPWLKQKLKKRCVNWETINAAEEQCFLVWGGRISSFKNLYDRAHFIQSTFPQGIFTGTGVLYSVGWQEFWEMQHLQQLLAGFRCCDLSRILPGGELCLQTEELCFLWVNTAIFFVKPVEHLASNFIPGPKCLTSFLFIISFTYQDERQKHKDN